MQTQQIRKLLEGVRNGDIELNDAIERLRSLPFESIENFATLDTHRAVRCGFPEVIFGQGKTPYQLIHIINHLIQQNDRILVTRLNQDSYQQIEDSIPAATYYPESCLLTISQSPTQELKPGIMTLTAGTADIPVAEEAALTAELMGNMVTRVYDVGVAGLHRLLSRINDVQKARVLIVVAGMDGALPSVVAGLVSAPVIAVPTSTGYGISLNGIAALFNMLNSCASGIAVVNIDNGFGAGYLASQINLLDGRRV